MNERCAMVLWTKRNTMALWKQYVKEVKKEIGELATWPPIDHVEIGSYGELRDGKFHRIGNIRTLEWSYTTQRDQTPGDMFFSSTDKVEVAFKAAGSAAPAGSGLAIGDAGFAITFHKEGGVFFKAGGVVKEQIVDTAPIRQAMLRAYLNDKWNKRWVVITEVHEAADIVVLVSKKNGVNADLKVKGEVTAAPNVANADVEVMVTSGSEALVSWTADKGCTPLIEAIGIRDNIFIEPTIEVKNFMSAMKAAKMSFPVVEVGTRFDGTED